MNRHTVNTITSNALDQLYAERDEARQHAATIAAQRDRLRQRMNTLADRWDNALAPDKTYARTLRAELTCAPFDPEGAMTVQEYPERGRRLWAFRCWGTDTCDGWLGLGHHTQTSALMERERHVAEAHIEPTPAATEAPETMRAEQAEATLARVQALAEEYPAGIDTALIHAALDQPKEQPVPTCTATIEGPHVIGDGPITCTREPDHTGNHVGPNPDGEGRTLWTDHNAGATPHQTSSKEQH